MLSTPTDTTCIRCIRARKRLQYHGLAARINSGDDGATSSKNLVNFCLVTPEVMAYLRTYVFVLGEKRPNTCIHRAAIQKCHGMLR